MRTITTNKDGKIKEITSPWYRVEEAAAYCGISRTEFDERARELPHAGKYRLRLYHQSVLDAWLNDTLGIPFDPEDKPVRRPLRRRNRPPLEGITNPRTGKFYPCPAANRGETATF
ncbi:MAG: helix-turn-helix domain-containing protein [Syntrophales bacterium]|jgi:hypothetical protein|nr:helix-turn-helix domain-containing protein [Syntrophales bacterium]